MKNVGPALADVYVRALVAAVIVVAIVAFYVVTR